MFGFGWIVIEIEDAPEGPDVMKLNGTYTSLVHIGSYKKLGEVFQAIMKDSPQAKECYSVYLNNPNEVSE